MPNPGVVISTARKSVDLKYLLQTNRMTVLLFHNTVFEHQTKETATRTKLHSILQNSEVSKVLRGAVDKTDVVWLAEPWRIPAVQIWGKICHKYEPCLYGVSCRVSIVSLAVSL